MRQLQAVFVILLHSSILLASLEPIHCDPGKSYPIPKNDNRQMLFYIQNSVNSNTVVYDVNLNAQGLIAIDKPVSIYWRRYSKKNGAVKRLKWYQERFAYGVQTAARDNGEFTVYASAYKKLKARLYANRFNEFELEISVSGHKARAYCAYIQLKDNDAWIPQVAHIDLFGIDSKTGELIVERLVNDRQPARHSLDKR